MTRIWRISCALLCWSFSSDAYSLVLQTPRRHHRGHDTRLFAVTPATGEPTDNRPGWRRMFRLSSRAPKMQAAATSIGYNVSFMGELDHDSTTTDNFVRNNMEMLSPSIVFPIEILEVDASQDLHPPQQENTQAVKQQVLPVEPLPQEVDSSSKKTIQHAAALASAPALEPMTDRRKFAPFMRGWVRNILTGRLDRWSRGRHVNMAVQCDLKSGWRDLLVRGKLACDATVNVDRIKFNAIRMSGGSIEARRLTLNLWSFFRNKSQKRFPNQFDFLAHNLTLTQEDLIQSPCIRNGLRRLLTRILNIRGMNAVFVRIEDITVLPGKLVCHGVATTILGSRLPFQVRTGLGLAGRGHVLTFPGLELSVSPGASFFVPILPEVRVDLGHNAQLLAIHLDDTLLQVSARVTITPDHTIRISNNYRQLASSYAAQCSVDVGRWLTRLGQFSL